MPIPRIANTSYPIENSRCEWIESGQEILEEERGRDTQNYQGPVFIGSTEANLDTMLSHLQRVDAQGPLHIGVSGWHNYDIAAKMNTDILIVDINPKMIQFHEITIDLLKNCEKPASFEAKAIEKLIPFLQEVDGYVTTYNESGIAQREKYDRKSVGSIHDVLIKYFKSERSRSHSWLSQDSSYAYMRSLALNGKIHCITGDLSNSNDVIRVLDKIRQLSRTVTSLYISNVAEWMISKKQKEDLRINVLELFQLNISIDSQTQVSPIIIDSVRQVQWIGPDILSQRIHTKPKEWIPEG